MFYSINHLFLKGFGSQQLSARLEDNKPYVHFRLLSRLD
jgi:hypothetical protein